MGGQRSQKPRVGYYTKVACSDYSTLGPTDLNNKYQKILHLGI